MHQNVVVSSVPIKKLGSVDFKRVITASVYENKVFLISFKEDVFPVKKTATGYLPETLPYPVANLIGGVEIDLKSGDFIAEIRGVEVDKSQSMLAAEKIAQLLADSKMKSAFFPGHLFFGGRTSYLCSRLSISRDPLVRIIRPYKNSLFFSYGKGSTELRVISIDDAKNSNWQKSSKLLWTANEPIIFFRLIKGEIDATLRNKICGINLENPREVRSISMPASSAELLAFIRYPKSKVMALVKKKGAHRVCSIYPMSFI